MVGKTDASSAGTGKETFGDILGKAGEDVKNAMAKSPAEAQGSAGEARDAKINEDMSETEGTEVLSKDVGKRGEGTPQDSKPQKLREADGAAEKKSDPLEARIAPAAVMAFTMEGNAQLSMEAAPEPAQSAQNLQSLLPQSSEEAQKNKNFLAMLSGQQIKTSRAADEEGKIVVLDKTVGTEGLPAGKNQQGEPFNANLLFKQMGMEPVKDGAAVKANTLLEAQLGNQQLASQALNLQVQAEMADKNVLTNANPELEEDNAVPFKVMTPNLSAGEADYGRDTVLNAKGMALFQQSEETMPSRAVGEVMSQADLQQAGDKRPVVPPQMVQAAVKENNLSVDAWFGKAQIKVENAEEMPLPQPNDAIMPTNLRGNIQNNTQSNRQNAAMEIPARTGGEAFTVPEQGAVLRQPEQRQDASDKIQTSLANEMVEDGSEITVKPLHPDARQMGNRQEQDFRQQTPQQPSTETVAAKDGQAIQQLAEEAAGDKAPVTNVQGAPSGPVSVFQQDLADSIRGTERQAEVPSNRDVQDDFQVARQIVEQARLIRRGENTEMVIKLHPDHLGELTLKVSVSANGAVNASFHSDNAQVRTIIENSLVQLKQELNNQGLKVDNVDVYAGLGDGSLPQGEGQQAWQQNQSHNSSRAGSFMGNGEDYGEDAEAVAAMQQSESAAADGVDYRV
ncbi:flagellar hook-length control protein FliK [Selenomonas ruminantium]|nr:flagellar hook-length control protein FliK [Selenomonas ruminantium]